MGSHRVGHDRSDLAAAAPLLINRKMQIKTTVRYHLTPVRLAVTKKTRKIHNIVEDVKKSKALYTWWEYKLMHPLIFFEN